MSKQIKSISEQVDAMEHEWPTFRVGKINRKNQSAVWTGNLMPQFTSYRVQVQYVVGNFPKVRVLAPPLERQPGNDEGHLPHVYGPLDDPTLCLFDPVSEEWDFTMLISQTIIPWTIDWLTFYEFWVMTGVWSGGGRHPTQRNEETSA